MADNREPEGVANEKEEAQHYGQSTSKSPTIRSSPPLLEEAQKLLSLSSFVYLFSDLRELSMLGKINISMDDLSLESDIMPIMDRIRGAPLTDPTGSVCGRYGMQIAYACLRALAANGLPSPSAPPKLGSLSRAAGSLMLQTDAWGKNGDDNDDKLDGLRFFEDGFKTGLIDAPPASKEVCCQHVGGICESSKLHYIQCFFDRIYEKAKSDDDDEDSGLYKELWHNLLDSKSNEREQRKSGRQSVIQNLDDTFLRVMQKSFHPEAPLLVMSKSAQKFQNQYVWTNDHMSHKECVYTIGINQALRRVYVIFRGTTTWEDIMKNTDFSIFEVDNPIQQDYPNKLPKIELNKGYSEYLFLRRVDTGRTKYDEIADRVQEYGQAFESNGDDESSGYTLCVCGHSLGGALAAMFGLFASADETRKFAHSNNAVRIFTYGSAIPGRISFAQAFQHQEYAGKLMHARTHNDGDIVPLLHPQPYRDFAHTGLKLHLQPKDKKKQIVFDYIADLNWWSKVSTNAQLSLMVNFPWLSPLSVGEAHGLRSYVRAIVVAMASLVKEDAEKMSLEDHYESIRRKIRHLYDPKEQDSAVNGH